ncbi:guanine nucleotide-binding protein subunit gamma 3 [Quercus suber]|uniref:Guanine nucleotide-binding protein subunit gamma 3 n=1 Tax=Quercus suber TaxID=58331 RepID=A0AAW0KAH7_QUESU
MAAPAQLGSSSSSSSVPSLPPPRPKSPPAYPDLYGKRRETAKVQMLEREIGFLEEELKSAQSLQPASRCCKEITDYVVANSDPFIPTNRKIRRPCRFWKWLCVHSCCCGECRGPALLVYSKIKVECHVLTSHGSAVAAVPGAQFI